MESDAVNYLSQLIQQVGFPVAAYAALFWYMMKQDVRHQEEMQSFSTAINNNTLVIQKLLDRMEANHG